MNVIKMELSLVVKDYIYIKKKNDTILIEK